MIRTQLSSWERCQYPYEFCFASLQHGTLWFYQSEYWAMHARSERLHPRWCNNAILCDRKDMKLDLRDPNASETEVKSPGKSVLFLFTGSRLFIQHTRGECLASSQQNFHETRPDHPGKRPNRWLADNLSQDELKYCLCFVYPYSIFNLTTQISSVYYFKNRLSGALKIPKLSTPSNNLVFLSIVSRLKAFYFIHHFPRALLLTRTCEATRCVPSSYVQVVLDAGILAQARLSQHPLQHFKPQNFKLQIKKMITYRARPKKHCGPGRAAWKYKSGHFSSPPLSSPQISEPQSRVLGSNFQQFEDDPVVVALSHANAIMCVSQDVACSAL